MQLIVIATIAVAIVGVAFAMQNNVPVTVNFLLWRFDSSLAMVLLLALAFGASIVALLTTPATLKRQWQVARQKRRIDELERIGEDQRRRISELERQQAPADSGAGAERTPAIEFKQVAATRDRDAGEGST